MSLSVQVPSRILLGDPRTEPVINLRILYSPSLHSDSSTRIPGRFLQNPSNKGQIRLRLSWLQVMLLRVEGNGDETWVKLTTFKSLVKRIWDNGDAQQYTGSNRLHYLPAPLKENIILSVCGPCGRGRRGYRIGYWRKETRTSTPSV